MDNNYYYGLITGVMIVFCLLMSFKIVIRIWKEDVKRQKYDEKGRLDWNLVVMPRRKVCGFYATGLAAKAKRWDGCDE